MIRFMDFQFNNWCNRSCYFCPAQNKDLIKREETMKDEVFKNTLNFISEGFALNKIADNVEICMNRYYEPMRILDTVMSRARSLKELIPNAVINMHTNGDYLTKENISKVTSDVSVVIVNLYDLDKIDVLVKIIELFDGITIMDISDEDDKNCFKFRHKNNVKWKFNYNKWEVIKMKNRGSILTDVCDEDRILDCEIPKFNMVFEHDGTIMPCCDLYSKIPEHKESIIGNSNIDSFETIYNKLQEFNYKDSYPCRKCNADFSKIYGVESSTCFGGCENNEN